MNHRVRTRNAAILPGEKGFYAFSFLLAIFGAVAVQKNTRATLQTEREDKTKRILPEALVMRKNNVN